MPEIKKGLSNYFKEIKLKKLSTFKNRTYSASLVKEFYASIALDENELEDFVHDGLNVFLNGKEFVVWAIDLGNMLKVKSTPFDSSQTSWPSQFLLMTKKGSNMIESLGEIESRRILGGKYKWCRGNLRI